MAGEIEFPEGFDAWPPAVRKRWLDDYHALYFPKLRWWDKPESDVEEDSGPRPKQLPPDHPAPRGPGPAGLPVRMRPQDPVLPRLPPMPRKPGVVDVADADRTGDRQDEGREQLGPGDGPVEAGAVRRVVRPHPR